MIGFVGEMIGWVVNTSVGYFGMVSGWVGSGLVCCIFS